MDQTFRFKSFPFPGWLMVLLIPVVIVYFTYAPRLFDLFNLGQINNKFIIGIIFLLPLYGLYYVISYLLQTYQKSNSYLGIKDGVLNLVMFSKIRWSVPISDITAIDATQGQRSVRADFLRAALSRGRGSIIGFSFVAKNQIYEVKPLLENFEDFKQTIISFNPSIKFEEITTKSEKDFYNQDLGKVIQEKADGLPVIKGFGKFVSKLNFATGFILLLIITIILIIWLAIATK